MCNDDCNPDCAKPKHIKCPEDMGGVCDMCDKKGNPDFLMYDMMTDQNICPDCMSKIIQCI